MAQLSFSRVFKRYPGGREALTDLSFEVEAGEMLFLTGHSGAGKTTLLKLVAVIERPTSGTVLLNGRNIGVLRAAGIPFLRRQLGLVFQDQKLLYDRSAFENLMLPLRICGLSERDAARRARAALDKVGLLDREKADPIGLSGGEQQRLCIARALVHRPNLLIADEPTANLDRDTAIAIMDMFKAFNAVGVTVIVSTHDPFLLGRYASRELNLQQGRLR